MIYFIGGPPRMGKSVLAHRVARAGNGDFEVIHGDVLMLSLQKRLQPEWLPDLFDTVIDPVTETQTDETKAHRTRRRDRAAWDFHQDYIRQLREADATTPIVLEGLVWPDYLASFTQEHRAVFLVDTSPDQAERLIRIKNDPNAEHNWMRERDYSDERIHKWVSFSLTRSRMCIDLCQKHGYRYFDIADGGMQAAEDQAFEYLLKNAV
jgi:hypothetical protein